MTIANGGTAIATGNKQVHNAWCANLAVNSGKWYWEVKNIRTS